MNADDCKPAIPWRIYRLPGSKEWWLIDHGQGTVVLEAKHLKIQVPVVTIDSPMTNPRAWLEAEGELYIDTTSFLAEIV